MQTKTTSLTDLIHAQWRRLSQSAQQRVLATRAVRAGWVADDGNAEVSYPAAESAESAAQDYVDGGDWGDTSETSWVTVYTWPRYTLGDRQLDTRQACSDERETHRIEVEAAEPECAEGSDGHRWVSAGRRGNGGGVISREECRRCGCVRITDTGAQHEGVQGLTSVRYESDESIIDWVPADDFADDITADYLGPEADEHDVEAFVEVLLERGPSHASRESWERQAEKLLGDSEWTRRAEVLRLEAA